LTHIRLTAFKSIIRNIEQYIPNDYVGRELKNIPEGEGVKAGFLICHAKASFHYQILSFLSVHNRLELYNSSLINQLLEGSKINIEAFLYRVEFVR